MDEIEKLLRKAPRKARKRLLAAMEALRRGDIDDLNIQKLSGSPLFRVRIGDFRIIFSVNKRLGKIIIESVRRRNEDTYKS
jgi:mRNA interferase RelE/StbE